MFPNLSTSDSYPPPKLKDFTIEKRLGTGTYAAVYKATCRLSNEVTAIKCIKKNGLNKSSTENLLREIKILKQVKHEYIVQLKDFQWDENYIYLIMEYCSGGDLSAFIRSRRTIPEKYVRRFVQQIACALKHLHSKGIAHMDLKPQNILLTSINNPSLKLADFGFAQYMRENKQSRSLRGSPLYMAPEILKCKVYDSKVDLWSVGVILYEVIFGYAPFTSSTLEELEKKILDDVPIQIPTHVMLSETCKDLLKRLLQRNPLQRITFEEFFDHPFVDLEHMASNLSYPKAIELLNKAVNADEKQYYLIAQRYYLQAIEYIIPAIQFEKDSAKKQEIRDKAHIYMKRAEELSTLIKPSCTNKEKSQPHGHTSQNQNKTIDEEQLGISNIKPLTVVPNNISDLPMVSSIDIQQTNNRNHNLLRYFDGLSNIQEALIMCIEADEKVADVNNCQMLYDQYEISISRLLPLLKNMPKENEKLLKLNIDKWLTRMESLGELNKKSSKIRCPDNSTIDLSNPHNLNEEENSSSLKQCILQ